MRTALSAILIVGALAASGCVVRGRATYSAGYSGPTAVAVAPAPAPNLVYISPGVQVIADYDYPVFYSDNWYWRYDNGAWYRSRYYDRGWYVSYDVPVHVRRIDRPHTYVRYRAGGGGRVHVDNGVRAHGAPARGGVEVRDHRGGPPADRGPAVDRGGPAVRDHRGGPPVDRGPGPDRGGPAVRDHREGGGPPADRGGPPADRGPDRGGPAVRDHRDQGGGQGGQGGQKPRDKGNDDEKKGGGPDVKTRDHRK